MGKYAKYQIPKTKPQPKVHPVWRGIGCLLWILIPLISYASAVLLVGYLSSIGSIPAGLLGRVELAPWAWKSIILRPFAQFIYSLDNLWAVLIFFAVFLVLTIGIFTTLYSFLYRQFGPPRYSLVDAPPGTYTCGPKSGRKTLDR